MTANRFRFRAWDSKISAMSRPFSFGDLDHPDYWLVDRVNITSEDAVLMQSTGLVDKNGKEIFEGDVIKDADDDWQEHQSKWVIKWECNPCVVGFKACCLPNMTSYEELLSAFHKIEVIGNIWENGDLLTKK